MLREAFDELCRRLVVEAERHYGPRLVSLVIFGSVGRGTERFDSDLDLLLICRDLPAGRMRRVAEFERIEHRLEPLLDDLAARGVDTRLSPLFYAPEEAEGGRAIFLDMVEDARILVDRGGFFRGLLDRLRARLTALGARRVWRGSAWYWVLKRDFTPGEVFEL